MPTCQVDVEPQSFFGVACGLLLRPTTGCPVHGHETEPAVIGRNSPESKVVEKMLAEAMDER